MVETLQYPERIEAVSLTIAAKNREIADLRNQIDLRQSAATLEILNARDENAKPLYSNETARSAAIKLALAANPGYQELERKLAAAELDRAASFASLERLRGEFKLYLLDRQQEIGIKDMVSG
ncbi:MAG TPA: hypothetical protein VF735_18860 [Pyrinomonadaceae bacterium]|jgi:hypothetical protein